MNNIYIQTLRLGFENPGGISFNEVIEKLNIDFSNQTFQKNYTLWFYENFYNFEVEKYLINSSSSKGPKERIIVYFIKDFNHFNDIQSFIKGDSVNKYIDYLELDRTRKSSKQAAIYSTVSIILAFIAIIISLFLNPTQPYKVKIIDDSVMEKIELPVVLQPEQLNITQMDSITSDSFKVISK